MAISLDFERLTDLMNEQAQFGGTADGGLHRLALSDEDEAVRDWFEVQMRGAGLDTRVDAMGNMFGRRSGTSDGTAPVLLGSHLDSQPYGGIYDGALGVIAALEFVLTLDDQDIQTPHPIEIVNWTNEEGARFETPLQGSGVWAGIHSLDAEYERTDRDDRRFGDELERIGYDGAEPCEPREPYACYLELHIEQGPKLESKNKDVGIVTDIVGVTRGAVTFSGEANHAGTTPMDQRRDALVPAADLITQIRRIPTRMGENTVGTAGYLDVSPNVGNIIPAEVTVTWDLRARSDAVLENGYRQVQAEATVASQREGVDVEASEWVRLTSTQFSDRCTSALRAAADGLDYEHMDIVGGAGHDAVYVSEVCDSGMLFAVSEGGISHSEDEYTNWTDCYSAANTLANAALEMAME